MAIGFGDDRNNRCRGFIRDRRLRLYPMLRIEGSAARQGRAGATEPGDVSRKIVPRGFVQRQIAPDCYRSLGLLDVLEKGKFAVKAAPAAGLEQFGEILQPLLGKSAP